MIAYEYEGVPRSTWTFGELQISHPTLGSVNCLIIPLQEGMVMEGGSVDCARMLSKNAHKKRSRRSSTITEKERV